MNRRLFLNRAAGIAAAATVQNPNNILGALTNPPFHQSAGIAIYSSILPLLANIRDAEALPEDVLVDLGPLYRVAAVNMLRNLRAALPAGSPVEAPTPSLHDAQRILDATIRSHNNQLKLKYEVAVCLQTITGTIGLQSQLDKDAEVYWKFLKKIHEGSHKNGPMVQAWISLKNASDCEDNSAERLSALIDAINEEESPNELKPDQIELIKLLLSMSKPLGYITKQNSDFSKFLNFDFLENGPGLDVFEWIVAQHDESTELGCFARNAINKIFENCTQVLSSFPSNKLLKKFDEQEAVSKSDARIEKTKKRLKSHPATDEENVAIRQESLDCRHPDFIAYVEAVRSNDLEGRIVQPMG